MEGFRTTTHGTSLGRALGLGSAKHGVGHFIVERVTALALIPLTLWGVWSAILIARGGYGEAIGWITSPVNAVLLSLTLVVGFWHMQVGMRVIIEDYLHKTLGRVTALVLNLFACVLVGALAVFSVLKLAFTHGAA